MGRRLSCAARHTCSAGDGEPACGIGSAYRISPEHSPRRAGDALGGLALDEGGCRLRQLPDGADRASVAGSPGVVTLGVADCATARPKRAAAKVAEAAYFIVAIS